MFHQLLRMMEEKISDVFDILATQFIQRYQSVNPSFVEIFRTKYLRNRQEWAVCYRNLPNVTSETDTSVYAENLHSRLRAYYMQGSEANRRIDDLLDVLLTVENEDIWRRKGEEEYKMDVPVQKASNHEGKEKIYCLFQRRSMS